MRGGFTLIELLVVIAISTMLAAVAITYTSVGRSQVSLAVATSQIAQSILRAKDLAIATYKQVPGNCGYGAYFDLADNTYSLFAFAPTSTDHAFVYGQIPPCPSVASVTIAGIVPSGPSAEVAQFAGGAWNVSLGPNVRLMDGGNNDTLMLVMFYPPDPDVFMVDYPATSTFLTPLAPAKVYLVSADGSASTSISVNPAGGVTF